MVDDETGPWVAAEMEELEVESWSVPPAGDNQGAASDSIIQGDGNVIWFSLLP